jgi:hypothetical protein
MGLNFEFKIMSSKHCMRWSRLNKLEQNNVHIGPTQNYQKEHEAQFGLLGPLEGKVKN